MYRPLLYNVYYSMLTILYHVYDSHIPCIRDHSITYSILVWQESLSEAIVDVDADGLIGLPFCHHQVTFPHVMSSKTLPCNSSCDTLVQINIDIFDFKICQAWVDQLYCGYQFINCPSLHCRSLHRCLGPGEGLARWSVPGIGRCKMLATKSCDIDKHYHINVICLIHARYIPVYTRNISGIYTCVL